MTIDPPTISVTFGINDSPLAGRDGSKVQSRVIRERLLRGDRPGAVQSLRQFQHKNPSRKVPDDLVRLLAG